MADTQWVSVSELARAVTHESNLPFGSSIETIHGQACPVIRPETPEKPQGFQLGFFRLPRLVICHLELDGFARELLDEISIGARNEVAVKVWESASKCGINPVLWVDDASYPSLEGAPLPPWRKLWMTFEFKVADGTTDSLFHGALSAALFAVGLVLSVVPHTYEDGADEFDLELEAGLPEGATSKIEVNRYERSRRNRMVCLSVHGFECKACGMNFHSTYGEVGREFIEVHHKVPIASMGGSYVVNPITDLVPLCSNCHRMVHRHEPPYSPEAISEMIVGQKGQFPLS